MFGLIAKVAQSTGLTKDNEFHIKSLGTGSTDYRRTHYALGITPRNEDHGALHVYEV